MAYLLLPAAFLSAHALAAEKMKPEVLVARHLDSIAPAEARVQIAGRRIDGTARAIFRIGGSGQLDGEAMLLSQGPKVLLSMVFPALEYPHEKYVFDGKNLQFAQVRPGLRSQLGQFLHMQQGIIKSGIFGGVLTTGWTLLDPAVGGAKLEYAGLRRSNNKPVHELWIRPKKAADLQISLFFEDGTFHHLRTQYRLRVSVPMGRRFEDIGKQQETHHLLIEEFADFRPEGPWMLPHQYKIELTLQGQGPTTLIQWLLTLARFDHQASLTDADFSIQN